MLVYTEELKYLDKAKQLDPQRNQANWAYNRYQVKNKEALITKRFFIGFQ